MSRRIDVDVALPEVSPAVFARVAAVPVSLPAITGVVSSAVFARGVVANAEGCCQWIFGCGY